MKLFLLLTTLWLTQSAALVAPANNVPRQFDAVTAAIGRGDVEALGGFLDNTVELALPGIDDIFTKAQAKAKLKGFFALHPPKTFTRVHGGTSKGDVGAYVIGSLVSGDEKYRVYVYGIGDATPKIQELRIERQ